MSKSAKAIRVEGLSKVLDGRRVLHSIDLEISRGECVALRGGNGVGKTTLLRCMAAITRPTTGRVEWFGQPAAATPQQRRWLGVVAHESQTYADLSLRENLMFAARMYSISKPTAIVETLLDQTGLSSAGERPAGKASRGMRQRLALACALIHRPRLLILDEPFSALDRHGSQWLADLFVEQRRRGVALCFTTHDERNLAELADRTVVIRNGQVVSDESKKTYRHASSVSTADELIRSAG